MKLASINIYQMLLLFCVFNNYSIYSIIGSENINQVDYIFSKIIENRNKVENYKCLWEKNDFISEKEKQAVYEDMLKYGMPQEDAEEILHQVYEYQIISLALDKNGCGRVEIISKEVDTKGIPTNNIRHKNIATWDDNSSIDYMEYSQRSDATIGRTDPYLPLTDSFDQPWRTYSGNFCDMLESSIKDNHKVNITKLNDGKYRIEFQFSEDIKLVGIIDPDQGYSVVLQEEYLNGKLRGTYKAEFKEVNSGIWFPVKGEYISNLFPLSRDIMIVKEIEINDPNFYDGLYHVKFKEGTNVSDKVTGLRYIVGEPMSQKVVNSGSLSLSMDDIAQKEIEQNPSVIYDIFIPETSVALREIKPFILNFSNNQLINPKAKPESEESDKYLKELGKGDIAWDGNIIAIRGASIITTKQNANKPLKSSKGNWSISFELPEQIELPYSILVITKENVSYLMNIKKIEPEGITINYKELKSEQISIYKD